MKRNQNIVLALLMLIILGGYWLLPIHGQIIIATQPGGVHYGAWPQTWLEPAAAQPGAQVTLYVRDNAPWPNVKLIVGGDEVAHDPSYEAGSGPWTWRWRFSVPTQPRYEAVFYHDCNTGCIERARIDMGAPGQRNDSTPAAAPTKLGVVFADFNRDWHGKAGWDVELTYAVPRADDRDFSIDGLARRVYQANERGLHVLVRVDYDREQPLPPEGDAVALQQFLDYCARLARDDRLRDVYAFLIGSGYNNQKAITPEWYARVFNGYGLPLERNDNVVQTMRAIRPSARVLVGPVAPWSSAQNGDIKAAHDAPWLNYFNTLVAHLDQTVQQKSAAGIPLAAPDGFALRDAGRLDAPEVANDPAQEPATDLPRAEWDGAQAGFRVYRDWLDIINRFPTTQGLPAFITSANTYTADTQTPPPAQNYPQDWLTTALAAINREPQIVALCWFVDDPLDGTWAAWSLQRPIGRMHDAATDFDRLLAR